MSEESFLPPRAAPEGGAVPRAGTAIDSMLALLVDQIDAGLVVCDPQGRILVGNRAARDELARQRLLQGLDGRLRCARGVDAPLDAALQHAARGRRRLLLLASATDQLMVSLAPLTDTPGAESPVLVLLGRREPCSALSLELFGSLHGLTLAERRVLRDLLADTSPREIADTQGVALCTVRSHIASIRNKLGVRSIEALLLRAVGLPPMSGALRGSGRPAFPPDGDPMPLAA